MTYPNVYASQTGPLALSSLDANFLYAVDIANAALTATAGGTADAITATYSPAPAALVAGLTLYVRAASANATTTPQFSPNGLTGKVITKNNNQALAVGDIAGAGHWLHLVYDATNGVWELINPATVVGAVQTGGTANGVAYLNASKAITSGTALTFDGTNLTSLGTITGTKLIPTGTSVTGNGLYLPAANALGLSTNGTNAVYIDASQNVGIGITPSAWLSTWKAIQNTGGALYSNSSNQRIGFNAYLDGATAFRYIATGFATDYQQGAGNGSHAWWIAPSGTAGNLITFTQAMTLDASGQLGVGLTSPGCKVDILAASNTSLAATLRVYSNNVAVNSAMAYDGLVGSGQFTLQTSTTNPLIFGTNATERMRIDSVGNAQFQAGAVMPYAPAPAAISAATTLTNANIQGQIISATGTTYTITMPLGSTLDTLASWVTTNIGYDFFVINTASGVITMAVNTGVTSLGSLTVAIGASAHFRIRRTAASTYVLYRLV